MADEDAQKMLMEMQKKQQQLQQIVVQKEETEADLQESKRALEELEGGKGDEVYESVGSIMVEKDRDDLKDELEEKIEDLEVRKQSLEKKQERLEDQVEETRQKFSQGLSG